MFSRSSVLVIPPSPPFPPLGVGLAFRSSSPSVEGGEERGLRCLFSCILLTSLGSFGLPPLLGRGSVRGLPRAVSLCSQPDGNREVRFLLAIAFLSPTHLV